MEAIKKIELELDLDLAFDRIEWLLRNTHFPEQIPSGRKPAIGEKIGMLADLALYAALDRVSLCQNVIATNTDPITIEVYEDDLEKDPDMPARQAQKLALQIAVDEFNVAATKLCGQKEAITRFTESQRDALLDYASAACWAVNKVANHNFGDSAAEPEVVHTVKNLVNTRLEMIA